RNYRFNNYIQLFDRMIHSAEQISEKEFLEKSALRLIFWKASTRIIGEKVWFGVGTGDVKFQIKAAYKDMGVYEELHENDDPHNQFLRTFIATGLPGFLALAGVFVFGLWRAIQTKDYFLLGFLILIMIHLFFKSMLFREDGVIFFGFFYGLLYLAKDRENPAV
ncbi:MAG: O-antigen ligase family protein, partial [Bacteroidales bacterium]